MFVTLACCIPAFLKKTPFMKLRIKESEEGRQGYGLAYAVCNIRARESEELGQFD